MASERDERGGGWKGHRIFRFFLLGRGTKYAFLQVGSHLGWGIEESGGGGGEGGGFSFGRCGEGLRMVEKRSSVEEGYVGGIRHLSQWPLPCRWRGVVPEEVALIPRSQSGPRGCDRTRRRASERA